MAQPHLIFADCRGLFRHKHLLTTVLFLLTIYFRFRYKDDLDAERLRLHRDMFLILQDSTMLNSRHFAML